MWTHSVDAQYERTSEAVEHPLWSTHRYLCVHNSTAATY